MLWRKILRFLDSPLDSLRDKEIEFLKAENQVLRQQLPKRLALTDSQRRLLAQKGFPLGRRRLADLCSIAQPSTILKWHRQLVACKFDGSKRRRTPGRPPTPQEIKDLVLRIARENPAWGYDRIAGALANLGFNLCDQTIGNILREAGLPIAPIRKRSESWAAFLKRHRSVIWATDFFSAEIWTHKGLSTFYVLFFIHLATRRVILGGCTDHPNAAWVEQTARNLTGFDEAIPLSSCRYLIHDRDSKYTACFDHIFESLGIEPLKLPPRSPNLNAFAERWVRSVKEECLEQFLFIGENSLRRALKEYDAHYHHERNHQGLDNVIPFPDTNLPNLKGPIIKQERLGGLLNFYQRRAT